MSTPPHEPHHLNSTPPTMAAQELRLVSALVLFLGLGLFLALPFVLSSGTVVFLPFVAAIMLSILLAPLADRLARLGLPNILASFFAVALSVAVLAAVLALILIPAVDTFAQVPAMANKASAQLSELRGSLAWLNDFNRQLSRLAGHGSAREVVLATPTVIEQLAFATPTVILEMLLTLLLAFFMVEARIRMRRRLLLERASLSTSIKAARMIREVQDLVASYMLTVGVINLGVGVIVTFGAWLLGFDAPVMWGGLAALLNFLPYVGPLVMIAVLTLFGIGTSDTLLAGLAAPLSFLALHAVEANLVTPAVLGRRLTLNPVLILLSISYFSWIWGVIGALLSVPILLTFTALIHHVGTPNLIGFVFGEPLFPALPDPEPDEPG